MNSFQLFLAKQDPQHMLVLIYYFFLVRLQWSWKALLLMKNDNEQPATSPCFRWSIQSVWPWVDQKNSMLGMQSRHDVPRQYFSLEESSCEMRII